MMVIPNGFVMLVLSYPAFAECPNVVSRPIPFNDDRMELTASYLQAHTGRNPSGNPDSDSLMTPRLIVLHWTATASLQAAYNTFSPTVLRGRPDIAGAGTVNVSAHYIVDRDGMVYQAMADTRVGRHTFGLNHVAIGIEIVGDGDEHPLTDSQVSANAALIRCLTKRHDISHLIGHYEYRKMEGTGLFVELDPDYRSSKVDPGAPFMEAVRQQLSDLQLQGPPASPAAEHPFPLAQ